MLWQVVIQKWELPLNRREECNNSFGKWRGFCFVLLSNCSKEKKNDTKFCYHSFLQLLKT